MFYNRISMQQITSDISNLKYLKKVNYQIRVTVLYIQIKNDKIICKEVSFQITAKY